MLIYIPMLLWLSGVHETASYIIPFAMAYYPWENKSLRDTYSPIEFVFKLENSDDFNLCFTLRPIILHGDDQRAGWIQFHDGNTGYTKFNGNVDFDVILLCMGEEAFRNTMRAYYQFKRPPAVSVNFVL